MPKHRTSHSYLVQCYQGSKDDRVRKPVVKKAIPQSRAEHQHNYSWRMKPDEPLHQLPAQYLVNPTKPHCNPPRFHFGVGVPMPKLLDYAIQQRLVPDTHRYNRLLHLNTMEAVVKHLDRISGVNLYLEPVSHPDYGFIVARYSNYSWYHEELAERPEQMVIDLIKKELNVDDIPQWHHNVSP